jgi:hypothetical protein
MPHVPDPLPPAVLAALQRGQTIEAIKLLRDATGLGLKEAKDAVDRHRSGPARPPEATAPWHGTLPPPVLAAIQQGHVIEAIRLLREASGMGLKEAMDKVEAHRRTHPAIDPMRSPGEVPRRSAAGWAVAAVLLLALVAWFVWRR